MATDVRHRQLLLLLILLGGAAVRGLYLYEESATPEFTAPTVDAEFHHYWAKGLAVNDWSVEKGRLPPRLGSHAYLRPPGYPFFLAAMYKLFGLGATMPRVVQMFLGLVNVLLAYKVSRLCLGNRTALFTAVLMAGYWIFIYYEGQLLEPALLVSCILAGTYFLLRWSQTGSASTIAMSGFFIGLAALTRPNALSILFAGVVWIVAVHRRRIPRPRRWLSSGGLVAAAFITIAPVTVRNYLVTGEFTLISANGGVNLYIGNNEHAQGFFLGYVPQMGVFGTCFDYPALVARLDHRLKRKLTYAQVDNYFAHEALDYACKHPGKTLRLTLKKAALFWSPHELSHNRVVHYDRAYSPILRSLPGNFALVVTFAAVGLWFHRSRLRTTKACAHPAESASTLPMATGVALLALMPVAYFVSFLPFFNAALYRVPIIPFLLIFSAGALDQVWTIALARDHRKLMGVISACVLTYLVARTPLVQYEPSLAEWHFGRGACYHRNGELESAKQQYRQSLALDPDYFQAGTALARALMESGQVRTSIEQWQDAIKQRPDEPQLWTNLGSALLKLHDVQPAVEHFKKAIDLGSTSIAPYMNLASAYMGTGDAHAAIETLRQGMAMRPRSSRLHAALGMALAQTGETVAGISHLKEAVAIAPDYLDARLNLGLLLAKIGQYDEAVVQYQAILQEQPHFVFAMHNLGVAYEALGRVEQATDAYQRALAIDNNLTLTHYRLGLLLQHRGQLHRAAQHLDKACTLGSGYAPACEALARINHREN